MLMPPHTAEPKDVSIIQCSESKMLQKKIYNIRKY